MSKINRTARVNVAVYGVQASDLRSTHIQGLACLHVGDVKLWVDEEDIDGVLEAMQAELGRCRDELASDSPDDCTGYTLRHDDFIAEVKAENNG